MKITYKPLGVFVVVLLAAGIGGAKLVGLWKTESTKQPVAIREGEFAGMPNPLDIRGSYTWDDVARAFNFDVELALKAFGASDPTTKVNTLESIYGEASLPEGTEIGTDAVRLFVSLLTGLPHAPEGSTILPFSAIEVLRTEGKASSEFIEEAAARAYTPGAVQGVPATKSAEPATDIPPATGDSPGAPAATKTSAVAVPKIVQADLPASPVFDAATPTTSTTVHTPSPAKSGGESTGEGAVPGTITGKTTFKEIKTWGLSEDQIKSTTGGEIGHDLAAIRDWASSKGLSFSEIKARLQALLDAR